MRWSPSTRGLLALLLATSLVLASCGSAEEATEDVAETRPTIEVVPEPEPVAEEPAPPEAVEEPEQAEPVDEPAAAEPVDDPEDVTVTAYVVAYHWGWTVFDEDGAELDVLRVPVGATVDLFAVNDHASEAIAKLPALVAEAIGEVDWHERVHHNVMEGRIPDPQEEEGVTLTTALDMVHDDHDLRNHGLAIPGLPVMPVMLDAHAHEPAHMTFVANREGSFDFDCSEECGFGHDPMRWEMLVVETGV
jgi:heme/copper-type cytochrome/quinol oxidase subunit 2